MEAAWVSSSLSNADMDIREVVKTCPSITEFQRKVYLELLNVPTGQTITYGELAKRIGCRSAQAVGQALKRNPFAPDVPCHRVIASDGSMCGFNGHREGEQIEKKKRLLREEGALS
ncbi:MAG: MGMT family protein [Bacteroidaceae bacterium]|nr:MGMT family protein [Bacteroidaceae bacterium]